MHTPMYVLDPLARGTAWRCLARVAQHLEEKAKDNKP